MKAVVCRGFDGPAALEIGEMPDPVPGPGQLLVDVHAAAVTFMDSLMVSGKYQMKPPLPFVPGSDAAGIVSAIGPGVSRFRVGDRVACVGWTGAHAERVLAQEATTVALPSSVDFVNGAIVRHGYGTAHYALVERARLLAAETVFVSGAAGGVGMAAVDLGRHLGARVIAGVGSPAKMQAVRECGAHEVIDYRGQDLKEAIRRLTNGRGVDVFFDTVGGEVFDTMSRLMNWGGRIIPVGFTSGTVPSVAMNLPLLKNYSIVGCYWGEWVGRAPEASRAAEERLLEWVGRGELRPLIGERVPLERAPQAIANVANRQAIGRSVVVIR
jgi:NADPH2:quinone reductase